MALGNYHGTLYGASNDWWALCVNGNSTFDMKSLNAGWCARFMARDTRDIKTVYINWSTATAPGTVQVRIETIDATSGKPSGSLYDAAATKDITPAVGWQAVTFDTLPTTGLVTGTEYAVLLLTTVAGTAHTLKSHTVMTGPIGLPTTVMTAADGTTRTNFADVVYSAPTCSLVMDDNAEETFGFLPAVGGPYLNVYGTIGTGLKFTVPSNVSLSVSGVEFVSTYGGTPAATADVRLRILNSSDVAVTGTTVTVDRDSLFNYLNSHKNIRGWFATPVTLTAGTYRLILDSANAANSTNCWRVTSGTARSTAVAPAAFMYTTTADVTREDPPGTPNIVWTDTAGDVVGARLILDDVTGSAGGGGGFPILGGSVVR